jgi:hypothetical protein
MTDATSGAGKSNPSGGPEITPISSEVLVAQSIVFCVVFCRSLFVRLSTFIWQLHCISFFHLHGYIFGIFKRFSTVSGMQ